MYTLSILCAVAPLFTDAFVLPSLPDVQQALMGQTTLGQQDTYLIELEPGVTRQIREAEKWELRRVRFPSLPYAF